MKHKFFTITAHRNDANFNIATIQAHDTESLMDALKKPLEEHLDCTFIGVGMLPSCFDEITRNAGMKFDYLIMIEIDEESFKKHISISQTWLYNTIEYNHDDATTAANKMINFGGGFVKTIGEAFGRGDAENKVKVYNAFQDYFIQYLKM